MKQIFISLMLVLMLPCMSDAQNKDWANFGRYAAQNDTVKTRPAAVLMGDSITDNWARMRPEFFSQNGFLGRGISGQVSSQMLVRFRKDVIAHMPKYAVILSGTNDIARNNGHIELEDVLGNIISMCEIAKANKIKPVLCSVLPASSFGWRPEVKDSAEQIARLNEMIKEYADREKITYVDYHSAMKNAAGGLPKSIADDGVHPNMEGYRIMEAILLGKL